MKILITESPHWEELGKDFQAEYEAELDRSLAEGSKLLPFGPKYLSVLVQPRTYDNIEETGDSGYTVNGELIMLSFDPTLPYGREGVLRQIKPTLFHEMNHAARYYLGIWHKTMIDSCLMEGLGTVFERDYADGDPLHGHYEDDPVEEWAKEVIALDDLSLANNYMYQHPDGRKWIGYKVGTWIIDQATEKSGKTVIDLTQMECQEILNIVGIKK